MRNKIRFSKVQTCIFTFSKQAFNESIDFATVHLRNEFDFRNVYEIMNTCTSGLSLQGIHFLNIIFCIM